MKLGFVEQILVQCFGMKLCFVEHKRKRNGLIIIRINKVTSRFNHFFAESSVSSRSQR